MSGIAGLYHLNDRPADPMDLTRMTDVMAHRGPDGTGHWREGAVGLGHLMLHTTPESLHETLPLTDPSGRFTITADARIDNRAELIGRLGVNGKPTEEIADSELILAAYKKWGADCPDKLLGAFAFALWDGREHRLFCARDHFGVKPFYYHHAPGRLFAFGSEIKTLLQLAEVPRQHNEERIGDFLATICHDKTYTFYESIHRLPPAHTLIVDRDGLQQSSYWSLDPERNVRLGSDAEYAERFRELFTEAVRCRLRSTMSGSAPSVGAFLSGGLDSSSIACTARNLLEAEGGAPLHTFSITYDQLPACDEQEYIDVVLGQGGFIPHYIPGDAQPTLPALRNHLQAQSQPVYAPNSSTVWKAYQAIQETGTRVVLDGHGGDEAVSHGYGYPQELARAGKWLTLARELRGMARIIPGGLAPFAVWWKYFRRHAVIPTLSKLPPVKALWKGISPFVRQPASTSPNSPLWQDALNEAFVQRIGLKARRQRTRQNRFTSARTERETHFRNLTSNWQPMALEVLDHDTAAWGLEGRYPFLDKRLVEFCLGLPSEQKLHHGWSRIVLRRAMEGVLSEQVRWRRDKANMISNVAHGLRLSRKQLDNVMDEQFEQIEDYVEKKPIRKIHDQLLSEVASTSPSELYWLWRVVAVTLWLNDEKSWSASSGSEVEAVKAT